MGNNDEIGVKISTTASSASKDVSALNAKLSEVVKQLNNVGYATKSIKTISNSSNQATKAIATFSNGTQTLTKTINQLGNVTKTVTKEVNKLGNQSAKASGGFGKLFNLGKFYAFWNVTKRVRDGMIRMVESAIDFIETTNKFEVSMGNMKDSAYDFVDTLANKLGLARNQLMDYQSTFNNIMKSLPRT